MFGYKLLKFATFFIYWLGFAPWLILILRKQEIISSTSLQDMFLQYTTVFFILIIIYLIIHQVFEYFYIRHKIKKTVRKVTIRHQLKRLEKGEIDLTDAQRVSTFTKMKESSTLPANKKVVRSSTRRQEKRKVNDDKELKSTELKTEEKQNNVKERLEEKHTDSDYVKGSEENGGSKIVAKEIQVDITPIPSEPPSYQEVLVEDRRRSAPS